ncbi:retropepsin-like aspartic protease [uncultured Duncaniella sp.]|nr:retropepsin-like aspartic protease [uncultured Duncaniella sp.]
MPDDAVKCRGKWDTGCNMTCISPTVANSLCLPPGRHIEVKTPHGTTTSTNTVFVSLKIPNGQILPSVEVCIAHMVDADMLIGMDVISLGDFALTRNKYGEMIMSICMPPMMTVDFNPVAAEVNNGRL